MTESTATASSGGGLFEDLIEVLYAPSSVFDRTRARKAFMYALVTAILVAVVAFATKNLMMPWFEAQSDLALKLAAAKGKPIPDAAAASMRSFTSWGIVVGAPLTMLIGPYINAALLVLGAKVMKAPLTYAQAAMVATLGGVPRILGWIALPVQGLVLDGSQARSIADLSLGPARFFDPATIPPSVLTLLGNLDVFRIWQIALIAIGVSVVARVPRSTGAVVAIIMLGVGAIMQLLPTALSS
jgi:hypothetical protein